MGNLKIFTNSKIAILATGVVLAIIMFGLAVSIACPRTISVGGKAEKLIASDYLTWTCSFSKQDKNLVKAYTKLNNDLRQEKAYLVSQGIDESEIEVS